MKHVLTLIIGLLIAATAAPSPLSAANGKSGLPLPRFVSLRANEVNLRTGPGVRYPIDWVFARRDLPVQVVAEFKSWRQIRDAEGTTGWVHLSMLSGKRTAMVNGDVDRMYREPKTSALIAAYVQSGIVGELAECDGEWCRLEIGSHGVNGWIERRGLWGVLPDEAVR